jgi:hypothetical protein
MQEEGKRQVMAFLTAARRLVDPNRSILAATSPYIFTGGMPLDMVQLVRGGQKASEFDADLIHLEFAPGAEADGPVNVMVSMSREANVVFFRRECRFWLDPRGTPFLIATQGKKHGTMSFDPDGMDSTPGKPAGPLARGFARADAKLRRLAAEALASGDAGANLAAMAA